MPTKLPVIPYENQLHLRKRLSAPSLLAQVRQEFELIKENRARTLSYKLTDVLMSALAIFGLKYPSLLQFDRTRNDEIVKANLTKLSGVKQAPSDTQMRSILDPVAPEALKPAFIRLHHTLQRQKVLEKYQCLGGYLISIDGTGQFSSSEIQCPECCSRKLRNGTEQNYHQLLAAAIVHPAKSLVFPLFPEATHQDGEAKNDCERNAAKRLIPSLRQAFPKLKMILLEDSLAANAPHLRLLQAEHLSYMIVVKDSDHTYLKDQVEKRMTCGDGLRLEVREGNILRQYRYLNQVPLNRSNPDLSVNYLEYHELYEGKLIYHCSWITDIKLTPDNVYQVMRARRAGFQIENETFNTLKTQDYHLEHNYGHGKQHLATVLAMLMMLHFLKDLVQEFACPLFQAARGRFHSRTQLWATLRSRFTEHLLPSWEVLWKFIIYKVKPFYIQIDTS